jgi:hypothetical protein
VTSAASAHAPNPNRQSSMPIVLAERTRNEAKPIAPLQRELMLGKARPRLFGSDGIEDA